MLVGLKRISKALGLLAGVAASTQGQALAQSPNQTTANAVAGALRASQALSGYRIEIETRDGIVTLSGKVATPAQKAEAVARVQGVPGVVAVSDQLRLAGDSRVQPVQYQPQVAMGGRHNRFGNVAGAGGGEIIYDGGAGGAGAGGFSNGPINDGGPLPEGPAGAPGATQAAVPGQPNYAWPSYAPYPNYSAVGYPTVYPWQAWPNIGPPHPYPEVPLDWRAVTLRWDDGLWWLDFKKHYTRPFFTPYPFGLFAY
ncbi:BON domain-containing protein [Singulisphaera acidiphila]|uniref:Putative periplasmic or secreted lipoprotein n=1 Tax=Singulisphaera acidiphila (strain ATCC BAA-1392 / DSM 18658 / VKM B-2454 / MOB10) TaxID=886293 RepID=L0DDK9_SINAD|nr:BON domain-containing protein [Singulisphaera acidiphila]AGA26903.1 putative periplasmic or secreted lipoprotein [Singulisphaera acidiphila DSM 18658]